MHKLKTFISYFKDFIKFGEYRYILTSAKYILLHKTTSKSRIYRSSLGTFLVRKGTLDFQFANHAYEWNVKQFVLKHYQDYDVFLDIGANMGTYSILLAGLGKKAYAFEPLVSNYNAIRINLILNNLEDQVKTYNLALGDVKQKAEFAFDKTNTGASHKVGVSLEMYPEDQEEIFQAQIVPLDEMMDELNIDKKTKVFMKIDVEGMEEQVLLGAKEFIKTHPNLMIVMESVHSGKEKLSQVLNTIAPFDILEVDDLNMGAQRK
ncbi:MAG: FkbM family methyltransferase [Bacteroidales bacterium]|nr:FkbM family methyltransferase [Bacteroidales bacterium]